MALKEEANKSRKREWLSSSKGQELKRHRLGCSSKYEVATKEEVAKEVTVKEDVIAIEDSIPVDRKGDLIFLYDDNSNVL